jgi:hypothetical protein
VVGGWGRWGGGGLCYQNPFGLGHLRRARFPRHHWTLAVLFFKIVVLGEVQLAFTEILTMYQISNCC